MKTLIGFIIGIFVGLLLGSTQATATKPPCNVIEKSERSFLLDKKRECTDAERASGERP